MEKINILLLEAIVAGLENEVDRLKLELKAHRLMLIRWMEVTEVGSEELREDTKFLIK